MSKPQFKQVIADTNDLSDDSMSILRRKFAPNKLSKAIWNSKAKCFVIKLVIKGYVKSPSPHYSRRTNWMGKSFYSLYDPQTT